ncbi:hypothetical protein X777_11673 [Ooceraea biroi]|uniref:Uncharacterized protein n=1 Tax=Ooceraea biroi TaxID=2015173 RepID=A0A026W150_OOCBI|nr:hypothetical protein X777_11673 [Ooceraea biroi]
MRCFCANAHLFRSAYSAPYTRLAQNSESSAAGGHFSKLPRCINNQRLRAVLCASGDNNENKEVEGVDFNLHTGAELPSPDVVVALGSCTIISTAIRGPAIHGPSNPRGLITPSYAKKSRTPIYSSTIGFPYLSCWGNSYEEPIMVSFVIVEPGEARITGTGKSSSGFVLNDENDRHVNDAFPVYSPTDADTRGASKS